MNTDSELPIDLRITPIDGRNYHKIKELSKYFSERALNSERTEIEIRYLIFLSDKGVIRKITANEKKLLLNFSNLETKDYRQIKQIENKCNHDVKAIEIFITDKLKNTSLSDISNMVHFGITSDDINSVSYARLVNRALKNIYLPILGNIHEKLKSDAVKYKDMPMLARTHGQPANATTYGKELAVYANRIKIETELLTKTKAKAKFSGNVGNYNAHYFVYPDIDWINLSNEFLNILDLEEEHLSTQIAPYDSLINVFQKLLHINLIFTGLAKDLWIYAMLGLLKQKLISDEVGSTALPHKINPIYLEGAEGGFEIANSLLNFYINKLSYSRLQRDLSDSTVRRSFGIAFSYTLLSCQSILEALNRLMPDEEKMSSELNSHPEIVSEAIQNYLKSKNFPEAYEYTKKFFRGHKINQKDISDFIDSLPLPTKDKSVLKNLSPLGYTGAARKLVTQYV